MSAIMKAFKKVVPLDSTLHRDLKINMPNYYSFIEEINLKFR